MPAPDWHGYLLKLRWQAARAITPRRLVACRGLKLTLQCENWPTYYRWSTYGTKERETLDWIDRQMQDGDVFFDIGANIGVYAIYAALRHPAARVVAFEPEFANLHLLRDNVLANGLGDRVEVFSMALSDRCGISRLQIQDLAAGAALHTESREPLRTTLAGRPVVWREGICAWTLDGFCEETGLQPHCLKLDVDGTEPRILSGAAGALGSPALRSVLLEMPADAAGRGQCERLLHGSGFARRWHDAAGGSANEVWSREEANGRAG